MGTTGVGDDQYLDMCKIPELSQGQTEAFSFFFFKIIYFNWRLITLQYCSGFSIH